MGFQPWRFLSLKSGNSLKSQVKFSFSSSKEFFFLNELVLCRTWESLTALLTKKIKVLCALLLIFESREGVCPDSSGQHLFSLPLYKMWIL